MRAAHSERPWQLGDLLRRLDVLADAAVHAQDDAVHERAHRQPFEEEVEPAPDGGAIILMSQAISQSFEP